MADLGAEFQFDTSRIFRRFEVLTGTLLPAAAGGLYRGGEFIMTDSKDNYCPVESGVMRNSGFVDQPVVEAGQAWVKLGYGGAAASYVVEQHERLDFKHDVGEAKFLETPLLKNMGTVMEMVGADVMNAVKETTVGD